MVALFFVLTIVVFLLADGVVLWTRRRRAALARDAAPVQPLAEMLPQPEVPGGVFLSPAHLWVGLIPAGLARMGLDPLIRLTMGAPDSIDAPAPGTPVKKGEPLFAAKWGRRSVLFHSPLDGVVHAACPASGELDPEGWVLTVEPAHAKADLGRLPMAEEARNWFAQEWARLRDFVVAQSLQAAPAISLPDGGRPMSGWMKLEPDATWDSFVDSFLAEAGTSKH
jgi:hypothetical protein